MFYIISFVKSILSPAKINLGIWVNKRRDDGYHEIFTLYQEVNIFDEILIKEDGPLLVTSNYPIPMEKNLVYKAVLEFQRETGCYIDIAVHIHKKIPIGSGLGGGSSNVAAILKEINSLLGNPVTKEELAEIASKVSSDAAFFLYGGTAMGRGRGEIIEPVDPLDLDITIVIPDVQCSTRKVYGAIREHHFSEPPDPKEVIEFVKNKEIHNLKNVLGELACEIYPEVGEVKRFLESRGLKPLVSGTGSAVFYIGKASEDIRRACKLRSWRIFEAKAGLGV